MDSERGTLAVLGDHCTLLAAHIHPSAETCGRGGVQRRRAATVTCCAARRRRSPSRLSGGDVGPAPLPPRPPHRPSGQGLPAQIVVLSYRTLSTDSSPPRRARSGGSAIPVSPRPSDGRPGDFRSVWQRSAQTRGTRGYRHSNAVQNPPSPFSAVWRRTMCSTRWQAGEAAAC